MVVITLAPSQETDPSKDMLGRTRIGYDHTMTDHDLYEAGRGTWKLDRDRVSRERHVLLVGDGIVQGAMEVRNLVPCRDRFAFEGTMLQPGDPIYDRFVGQPSPVTPGRNPVRYFNPQTPCACGCGQLTDKDFLPGHDQRAIHSRISSQFRSVLDFIHWFDSQFPTS